MKNFNYFCTWSTQSYNRPPKISARDNLTENSLFRKNGWLDVLDKRVRENTFLLLDDGWDVPYGLDMGRDRKCFGTWQLQEERFPSFQGSQIVRLRKLREYIEEVYEFCGLGLWVPAQICEAEKSYDKKVENYLFERMEWCEAAGICYLKVDWGKRENDERFRRIFYSIAKTFKDITVEQAVVLPPYNGFYTPHKRYGEDDSVIKRTKLFLKNADVFRTYDVTSALSVSTTLDRVGEIFRLNKSEKNPVVLNCEDEVYLAAAMGFSMGIMRNACWEAKEPGTDFMYDLSNARHRNDEVIRALLWQKCSPVVPLGLTENYISDKILTDEYQYEKGQIWFPPAFGVSVTQSAPAVMARNMPLPVVKGEPAAFCVASRNPYTGAYSVATLPRMLNRQYTLPLCDVEIEMRETKEVPIGVFGRYKSLTVWSEKVMTGKKVYAVDLKTDEYRQIGAVITEHSVVIEGKEIDRICENAEGDVSFPGVKLEIK